MNNLCLNLLSVNQNMIQHLIIQSIKNNAWIHAEKKNCTKGDTGVTLSNPYDYLLKCMSVCQGIQFRPIFPPKNFFKYHIYQCTLLQGGDKSKNQSLQILIKYTFLCSNRRFTQEKVQN